MRHRRGSAGRDRVRAAVAKASPSRTGIAGSARALAGTPRTGRYPNWSHRIGAVSRLQPSETATPIRTLRGSGTGSRRRAIRGTIVKIAATAANESWKPGSKRLYGFQPSSATAATSRAYHASRSLPLSQASEARDPATPARITDGCGPTAST